MKITSSHIMDPQGRYHITPTVGTDLTKLAQDLRHAEDAGQVIILRDGSAGIPWDIVAVERPLVDRTISSDRNPKEPRYFVAHLSFSL